MSLLLSLILLSISAFSQESLDAILDRGYVAHWLVCGPLASDVDGGIAAAVRAGDAPLGVRDYLASMGGVAGARPAADQPIQVDGAFLAWQAAGVQAVRFDLAPLFADRSDGVALAAFYCQAAAAQVVYLEFQSALGARIWVNGTLLRDIEAGPLSALGVTRLAMTLRPGPHLFVFAIPGATFETLAEAAGISLRELGTRALASRTLLQGTSGFEFALRLERAQPLGELYVLPALDDSGAFSGSGSDIRQDMLLTLFNPKDTPATPATVSATVANQPMPVLIESGPIPAGDALEVTVPIPVGGAIAGQSIPVALQVIHGAAQTTFNDTVVAGARSRNGRVFVVAGTAHRPDAPEDQTTATERGNQSFVRQMILHGREPDYGFDLGPAEDWQAALLAYPDQSAAVRQGVGLDQLGAQAALGRIDERLVDGELLFRNIAMGIAASNERLQRPRLSYVAWNQPGIAAQTPQLLSEAGVRGILSNLEVPGLPPLFHHLAPDGTRLLHRREAVPDSVGDLAALRDRIRLSQRALAPYALPADVVLHESATPPPDPFLIGAAASLKDAYPPILLRGGAADAVFEQLAFLPPNTATLVPHVARDMTARRPGSVMAQPELKQAHAALTSKLRTAEFLATLAALWGADYPGEALDYAWRQAIFAAAPERLGLAETPQGYFDALAACRDAATWTDEVLRNAGTYAAALVDTRAKAPVPPEGAQALVVFNPTCWERSDLCSVRIERDGMQGCTLIDDAGLPQPYHVDQIERTAEGAVLALRLRFLARNIPPMGYRCYYVLPSGAFPEIKTGSGTRIENDALDLEIDPDSGAIRSLMLKASNTEYAAGALNDVVVLSEDASRTDSGWELWTTGTVARASETKPSIAIETTDWMQQATVTTNFAGGTLTRRYVLFSGKPSVHCETVLDGIPTEDRAIVATFATQDEGRAPVHGVPFAAQVGRRSKGVLDFRTTGIDNLSGTAAQPALHWTALSPNDSIRTTDGVLAPLSPAAIVYGKDPLLKKAAETLQSALAQRGIPSALWPDTPRRPDPYWEDGTEFAQFDADLDHGTGMRFVLGHPERNAFAQELMASLSPDAAKEYLRRVPGGAVLYVEDDRSETGHAPVPTLLLGGTTAAETAALANQTATAIAANGEVVLPAESVLGRTPGPIPSSGLAVLFDGTMLSSAERDGTMVVGLVHGHTWDTATQDAAPATAQRLVFRYALLPFQGSWRDADLPAAAQAFVQPLLAMPTDLHAGTHPPADGLLRVSQPGLLASALKPSGFMRDGEHPRNGVLLRTWETLGRSWTGSVEATHRLTDVRAADFLGLPKDAIPLEDNAFDLDLGPFAVASTWLLPMSVAAPGKAEALAGSKDRFGAMLVRYWRHNTGAAPPGGLPVSVLLRDGMPGEVPTVEAVVANPGSVGDVEGVLYLRASEGWSIDPTHVYYHLAPGDYARHAATLLQVEGPAEARGATVHTVVNGVTYRDVLDDAPDPEMTVARNLAQIKVTVRSRSGLPLEGHVDLVVSPQAWPELQGGAGLDALNAAPPLSVLPSRAAVVVPPYGTRDVLFRVSDPDAPLEGLVRLSANGRTVYALLPEGE